MPYVTRHIRGIIKVGLEFETITGLLVRMPIQAQAYRIGGADQYPMVTRVKYHFDDGVVWLDVPFIPGSSFKGRMRSLLELSMGLKLYTTDNKIWQHVRSIKAMDIDFIDDVEQRCVLDELFGWAAANFEQIEKLVSKAKESGKSVDVKEVFERLAPTRLLVDDFMPSKRYIREVRPISLADFLEEKSENRIDRVTSAADPRDIVRVKPGVVFGGNLRILLFDNDSDMAGRYLQLLATGLELLEETYLGGSGSRGYGRIKFTSISVEVLKVVKRNGLPRLERINDTLKFKSLSEFKEKLSEVVSIAKKVFEG
jgi:CRISPR-associated protein Csm3